MNVESTLFWNGGSLYAEANFHPCWPHAQSQLSNFRFRLTLKAYLNGYVSKAYAKRANPLLCGAGPNGLTFFHS
jgi:hypothetical protein